MSLPLLKIATTPAPAVASTDSVADAVALMVAGRVGAVAVVDDGVLAGIFTERDLMRKVVHTGADAGTTKVGTVMVEDPVCVTDGTPRADALELMIDRHFRHLPVVDESGVLEGMLSIRSLLRHQVHRLQDNVQTLEQYLLADGPGG